MRIPGLATAAAVIAFGTASAPAFAGPDAHGEVSEAFRSYLASLPPGPEPAASAILEPAPAPPLGLLGDWRFRAIGTVYMPDANVEAEIGGTGGHVDGSFGDQFLPALRAELTGTRFGVLFEVEFRLLDADDDFQDYDLTVRHYDLGLIWRVLGGVVGAGTELDVFAGARFVDTEQDAVIEDEDSWTEPFAGVQFRQPLPILPAIFGRATASGFDTGPTTLHWTVQAGIEITLGPLVMQLGWRYDDMHFKSDSMGGYGVDVQSSGPFIGAGIEF